MKKDKTLRVCDQGHEYYKSTDCPTCPVCELENKPKTGFLAKLNTPASRTLIENGIDTLEKVANYAENEILNFHGIGKSTIKTLKLLLEESGLKFKE